MRAYTVNYDLKRPGQNYEELFEALKSYGTHWHPQGSLWIIASSKSAAEIRDHLRQYIDANDSLLVSRMGESAWYGMGENGSAWLKQLLQTKQTA